MASGRLAAGYETYRRMRRDPTIALARALAVAPVVAGKWTVQADANVPREVRGWIDKQFLTVREPLLETILKHGYVDFGHQGFELVWGLDAAGRQCILRFKPLLPDITEILIDGHGGLAGLRQKDVELTGTSAMLVSFGGEGSTAWRIGGSRQRRRPAAGFCRSSAGQVASENRTPYLTGSVHEYTLKAVAPPADSPSAHGLRLRRTAAPVPPAKSARLQLWRLMERHFDSFRQVYPERFAAKYGFWRPVVERAVAAFLRCGDLAEGFARVRCPDCRHEFFVAFSCKQRCACPSCHQKRALLTARHVAEEVCFPVAHRQVVLTIPSACGCTPASTASCWASWPAALAVRAGRDPRSTRPRTALPGMVVAIQTHGELLHWHPHIHALVTCGAFTAAGEWLAVPELDKERLRSRWREEVFALYLAEGKIDKATVRTCRGWPHSGFGADQSVLLAGGDRAGVERVAQYITRCPFSLARLVEGDADGAGDLPGGEGGLSPFSRPAPPRPGQGDEAEFPTAAGVGLSRRVHATHSAARLRHLACATRLVLEQVAGMRRKAAAGWRGLCQPRPRSPPPPRCEQTWAMLIEAGL